jgi:hypothetical protein
VRENRKLTFLLAFLGYLKTKDISILFPKQGFFPSQSLKGDVIRRNQA